MFETGLSFFQNKSYRTEYDKKLKQLRNHIQPKQIITYKLKLSPEASCNLKSCPLELKPAKLSDTIIQFGHKKRNESKKKKRKHHRSSKSMYIFIATYFIIIIVTKWFLGKPKDVQESKSVQTNVDDSILSGLQTVIDLCGLLEKCEEKKHKAKKSKRKIKKSRKYSEFTNHSYQTALETSTSRDSISFDEICDSPSTKKFSTEIRSFRKLFSSTSNANPPAEPINESLYRQSLHVLSSQQLSVPEDEIQNELRKQLAIPQVGYGDISKKRPDVSNCSCFVANMTPIEEESLICFNSSHSYCEKVEKSHSTSVFSEHCSEQQISSGPSEDNLILSRHPDPIYPMNLSCLRVAKQDVSYENQMQEISSHGSSLQSISGERPNTSHSVVGLVPDDVSISENRYSGNFPDSCVPNRCPKLNKCDNPHCLIPNPEVADYSSSSHCNPSTCPNLGSRQFDNSPTLSQPIPSCSACSNSQRQVTLSTRCFSPVEVVPTSPTNTAAVEVDNKERK